jgi:hypothetical protein
VEYYKGRRAFGHQPFCPAAPHKEVFWMKIKQKAPSIEYYAPQAKAPGDLPGAFY